MGWVGADTGAPPPQKPGGRAAWPLPNPPPGGGRQQLTGWGPQFMGWREPGLWRVGSSGASDKSLPRTAGQLQDAMSCWGEMQGGTRRVRVPHRPGTFQEAQKRSREEELKRQQNRNRNSEEGLPSGGEGKQRLGDGSRPAGGRRALGPSLSLPHAARCSGTGREVSGGGGQLRLVYVCAHTHTHTHVHTHTQPPASCCRTHTNGPRQCSSKVRLTEPWPMNTSPE